MTKKTTLFILALTLLGSASVIQAEQVMTWDDCVKIALQNNPDIRAAFQTVERETAQYKGSYNGILPQLNLTNSYNRSKNDVPESRWQASGAASVDLFNKSAYADIKLAGTSLEQAKAIYQQTTSGILYTLRKAFADLLFAEEQVNVAKSILDIRERNARMVDLRYSSGRESKGNNMKAQAEKIEAKANMAKSARDLKAAQQELLHQLGQDQYTVVLATGSLSIFETRERPNDFIPIVENHPDVLIQKSNVTLSEISITKSQSSLWPRLSANYTRSFRGANEFPDNPTWSASGILSYPLFGGGPTASYYSIKSARRDLQKSQESLRSTRNKIQSDLESNWAGLETSQDQLQVRQAFLDSARQRNAEADIRYSSGLLNYENWESIVTDRVNSEQSLIRAKRDAVIAEALWLKTTGKELGAK